MRPAGSVICTFAILLGLSSQVKSGSSPAAVPLLYTSAKSFDPSAWMSGKDRFPLGATIFIQDDRGRRKLFKNFAVAADPAISFDGTRILFAGKKRANDHWQIWEAQVNGSDLRRVTSCLDDCVRPLYLPEDRVVYAEKVRRRYVIAAAPLAGGTPLALTHAPGNFIPTDVLRDGRILFEASYPFGARTGSEIYTVYSDGSGVESYRCDHGAQRHSGRQLDSGDVVFAHGRSLARFTSALAHEVGIETPQEEYAGDVVEMASGEWLLTSRSNSSQPFRISRWTAGSRRGLTVVTEQNSSVVQPTLLAGHPIPNRHPSALHDWSYANLLCLNAYTSKYRFAARAISSVRLYSRSLSGSEELLGEAAVETDGSFYLRTPADQPLKIELLDSAGKTLRKEAGWFWLRRGEQRICVGCHAGPERAPENSVPAVLLHSTIAADMTGKKTTVAAGGH
jgi:hypothetical protein